MSASSPLHVPVLLEAILQWLQPAPGQIIVDGTLGGGGHSGRLAEAVSPGGRVIAFDRDAAAIASAHERLAGLPITFIHSNYADLLEALDTLGVEKVDSVLLDLGLSSDQLDDATRGFSFEANGPLDLRFDTSQGEPAWALLERLRADEIADIIYQFGEERFSRRIARRIVEARDAGHPVRGAGDLADLVRRCVPRSKNHRIDPATRTFQALRIAVNEELRSLEKALSEFPARIRPGESWRSSAFIPWKTAWSRPPFETIHVIGL